MKYEALTLYELYKYLEDTIRENMLKLNELDIEVLNIEFCSSEGEMSYIRDVGFNNNKLVMFE